MNNFRRGVLGVAVVGSLLGALTSAGFAGSGPTAEQKSACMSDVMRFCFTFNMNMDTVGKCLKSHKSEVSPRCRALMDKEDGKAASAAPN